MKKPSGSIGILSARGARAREPPCAETREPNLTRGVPVSVRELRTGAFARTEKAATRAPIALESISAYNAFKQDPEHCKREMGKI